MGGRLNGTLVVAEVIKNVLNNINNDHYCMTIEEKGYNFIPKSLMSSIILEEVRTKLCKYNYRVLVSSHIKFTWSLSQFFLVYYG